MSENPVNADHSRHIDTRRYWLRDMVSDRILKLHKVAGTQNVVDALTKSLPYPSFSKHCKYLQVSGIPFEAFYASIPYGAAVTA
eukprot:392741-Rhodomonas_salina.1